MLILSKTTLQVDTNHHILHGLEQEESLKEKHQPEMALVPNLFP